MAVAREGGGGGGWRGARRAVVFQVRSGMITFEKSSPVLNWLLETAFQGFYISKISEGACPQTPLAGGAPPPWLLLLLLY